MVLVKSCSLGTESKEGNLDLATLLTPASMKLLYLMWLGLFMNSLLFLLFTWPHASFFKETSRRTGFKSQISSCTDKVHHRLLSPWPTQGTGQPGPGTCCVFCLGNTAWLMGQVPGHFLFPMPDIWMFGCLLNSWRAFSLFHDVLDAWCCTVTARVKSHT